MNAMNLILKSIEAAKWAKWIMEEIQDDYFTRKDVAHTYAILMYYDYSDYKRIDRAILKRWSQSGLEWIRREARRRLAEHSVG